MCELEEWVIQAQAGDEQALTRTLEALYPSLLRYIRAMIGVGASEDVVQDALVVIYRKIQWLDDPAAFRAWAYRIAHRLALRELSRRARVVSFEDDDEMEIRLAHRLSCVSRVDWTIDLERAVSLLPQATRSVLSLRYGADLSLAEIAAALDIPLGTTKSRLAYGLNSLRKSFRRNNER